jgi:choline dehydrogenase
MGVEVRRDVPEVGRNLQELAHFPSSRLVNTPTYNSRMGRLDLALHTASYLAFRRGQLAAAPVQAMAFLRSRPGLEQPNVKYAFSPLCIDVASQGLHKRPGITVYVLASAPKSRGEIRLRSPDVSDKPVIDHRLLGDADDVAAIVWGAKRLERIYEAPALASRVVARNIPADQPRTDEEWEAQVRTFSSTGFQPIGTCRMGADSGSVVDASLAVRGFRGLRVADASVMPMMPSANTNAPTIMIAERAADLIRRSH